MGWVVIKGASQAAARANVVGCRSNRLQAPQPDLLNPTSEGRRDLSNVPAQALAMLNDPFIIGQADAWGQQLIAIAHRDPFERINVMFQQALSRPPTADEHDQFTQLLNRLASLHKIPAADRMTSQPIWKDMAHVIFNLKEFIYLP